MPLPALALPPSSAKPVPPRGRLSMLLAAVVVVMLPFVYLAFMGVTGWLLVMFGDQQVESLALSKSLPWQAWAKLAGVAAGAVAWICLFKPLLPSRPTRPVSLELKAASQPDLFAALKEICRITGAGLPSEVRVDCSMGVQARLSGGLLGLFSQRTALILGLPLAASTDAREFAGALANALGRYPRGLHGRLTHLVRAMNSWFDWAVNRRDKWQDALQAATTKARKKKNLLKRLFMGFLWLTQRPMWFILAAGKAVSIRPLRLMVHNGDQAEAAVTGSQEFAASLQRRPQLLAAWRAGCASVQAGKQSSRLPDNFPQTVSRHASASQPTSKAEGEQTEFFMPTDDARLARAAKLGLPGAFAPQGPGASLIRDFGDASRQATQMHYQHDLHLDITQFRLIAADEAVNHKRRTHDSLGPVKRFFSGLVHPERGLCGESSELSIVPDAEAFRIAIREGREWTQRRGDQMRATLREWHMAWQRVRDLEMAHAFALGGIPVDSFQYGVSAHQPELYREEIERQTIVMNHSEDPLIADEAALESRFAAALGLLCEIPETGLPPGLLPLRQAIPDQVATYQELVARLPHLRDLITLFSAFESLGAKFGGPSSNSSFILACNYLVPRVMLHTQRVMQGLDRVPCPAEHGGQRQSIADYLIGHASQQARAFLQNNWEKGADRVTHQDAMLAAELLSPLVDRFIDLYHDAFAKLASAAEMAEMHLVDFVEEAQAAARPPLQALPEPPSLLPQPAMA